MKQLLKRLRHKLRKLVKSFLINIGLFASSTKCHVFVVGCQRSGTSMLLCMFDRDFRTTVFREIDAIFSTKRPLRLKPVSEVKHILKTVKTPLIISKPLLDSQYTLQLLEEYSNSYAIWIYRNFKDVAVSNIRQFGGNNGRKDLAPILSRNRSDWRAEYVPDSTLSTIQNLYSDEISNADAAALFWYARNKLFFDLKLYKLHNVILCKYEDLVLDPENMLNHIYSCLDMKSPNKNIYKIINKKALGRGKSEALSPEILSVCNELYIKLNNLYVSGKSKSTVS